jgi:hypothetical protein
VESTHLLAYIILQEQLTTVELIVLAKVGVQQSLGLHFLLLIPRGPFILICIRAPPLLCEHASKGVICLAAMQRLPCFL